MVTDYRVAFDLLLELSRKFGDDAVEQGVINILNKWDAASTVESSFAAMMGGMVRAGVTEDKLAPIFGIYQKLYAQNKVLKTTTKITDK